MCSPLTKKTSRFYADSGVARVGPMALMPAQASHFDVEFADGLLLPTAVDAGPVAGLVAGLVAGPVAVINNTFETPSNRAKDGNRIVWVCDGTRIPNCSPFLVLSVA